MYIHIQEETMDSEGLSPADLKRYGQSLYGEQDYQKAAQVFSEVLKFKLPDPSEILDHRAATYCQLGDFELALRDARQIIQKNSQDERGYLRAAKVLVLNKKPDKALEMYAYGLKTLHDKHPRRQLLEQLHKKLRDQLTPIFRDPLEALPLEIVMMILQHFNFKQIVAILRVSKQWERLLSSLPKLWMNLDFSRARSVISLPAIRACINRSKAMLTHAIFVNISLPAVDKALLYLSRCPNLEYLDLQMPCKGERIYELFKTSKSLRTLIVSKDIPLSQRLLTGFLADLPALERIESHRTKLSPAGSAVWPAEMPNLKAIALSSWDEALSKSIPNLEELSLRWNSSHLRRYPFSLTAASLPKLRRLHLTRIDASSMVLPPTLEYLRFDGCTVFPFVDEDPPLKLPNLHSLIIEASFFVNSNTLRTLLDASEEALRYLHFDSGDVTMEFETVIEATATKGLREFSVAYMSGFTDSHVRTILNSMPELKVLRVPYTDVTGCSIKAIVESRLASLKEVEGGNPDSSQKRMPNIELVDIRFCENLSSDAVVYGRARGIEIIE
ncbi:hypothetical protein V8E54_003281 [Elaphomyces granulatus]